MPDFAIPYENLAKGGGLAAATKAGSANNHKSSSMNNTLRPEFASGLRGRAGLRQQWTDANCAQLCHNWVTHFGA
jgi:hypothetical protein